MMRALGEEFRAAREARGLSLSDVADHIHIRSVYLQALENEDWSVIGAAVYARGFIRTYARFLGLDPESAVARFNDARAPETPASQPSSAASLSGPAERRSPSPALWIAAVLAFILVAAVGYNYYSLKLASRASGPRAAIPAATPAPAVSAPAVAESTPAPTPRLVRTMTLRLSAPSWVRIVVDGDNVMEGTFPQGTVRTFHGKKATIRIGNAGGVDLDVNGKDLGKLGSSGDVVERSLSLAGE